ncbi:hypothetical protein ACE6H2_018582 [Prunus campanulata]
MESTDDEKDAVSGNYIPKELTHALASTGAKFIDEVLSGQNERCLENFRMDKHRAALSWLAHMIMGVDVVADYIVFQIIIYLLHNEF